MSATSSKSLFINSTAVSKVGVNSVEESILKNDLIPVRFQCRLWILLM